FLTVICALLKAVDTYAPMIRAAVASEGKDNRIGENEENKEIV
ncbi:hypothetical protein OMAG_002453, partial [Candidatus Omnitrophus magneticus]